MYNTFIIKEPRVVDIKQSLFSGQTFLWNIHKFDFDYYSTLIDTIPLFIRQISGNEFKVNAPVKEIKGVALPQFIRHYFSLEIDIENVFPESFSRLYPELWVLLSEYFPLRILRQDPFETMISFMCAQGIGMHLIRKQVSLLAQTYGEKTTVTFKGREVVFHNFPTAERLAAADPFVLSRCTNNNRLRAANIIMAAQGVAEGRVDLKSLGNHQISLSEVRRRLAQNSGIGFKIADCIALFGLGRFDAFPIDTHVKQYLGKWFNSTTALRSLSPATYLILDEEARAFLNPELAGYAGHILFHCWRKEVKKLQSF
ncbi:MAG: Fe-S cluster assembly protein HesB [Chlorobiales bacterium]|nr:Fe-S cluster assembly protein HesB [Chlorobiales bacterium]